MEKLVYGRENKYCQILTSVSFTWACFIWHNPELEVCKTVLLEKQNRILDPLTLEHAWDLPTNCECPLLLIKQVYYARPKLMI